MLLDGNKKKIKYGYSKKVLRVTCYITNHKRKNKFFDVEKYSSVLAIFHV